MGEAGDDSLNIWYLMHSQHLEQVRLIQDVVDADSACQRDGGGSRRNIPGAPQEWVHLLMLSCCVKYSPSDAFDPVDHVTVHVATGYHRSIKYAVLGCES